MKKTAHIKIALAIVLIAGCILLSAAFAYRMLFTGNAFSQAAEINHLAEDGSHTVLQVQADTRWKRVYPGEIRFQDADGTARRIPEASFVRYADGGIAAFTEGVVVDTGSVAAGLTNSYYLAAGTTLQVSNGTYLVSHSGTIIPLKSLLYKISDDHMIAAGGEITFTLPDGTSHSTQNPVELTWLEEGILHTAADGQAWLSVVQGYQLSWNGSVLHAEDKTVTGEEGAHVITLSALRPDSSELIETEALPDSPHTEKYTWNFNIIDGTDGEDGEDGQVGENGTDGEAGTDGSAGGNGADGADGTSGANGKTGSSEAEEEQDFVDAAVSVTKYDAAADRVSMTVQLTPGTWTLKNFRWEVVNKSGAVVSAYTEAAGGGSAWTLSFDESKDEDNTVTALTFRLACTGLQSDSQYTMRLSADCYDAMDTFMGTRLLMARSFYTDSHGVRLRQALRTQNGAEFTVTRKDPGQHITLELCSAEGALLKRIGGTQTGIFTGEQSEALSIQVACPDLEPDTDYLLRVVTDGVPGEELPFTTLKRMPTFGSLAVEPDVGSYHVWLNAVQDPDHSIVRYQYRVIVAEETLEQTVAKDLVTTAKNGSASLVFDDTVLKYGIDYTVEVEICCFDNEKQVLFTAALEDLPSTPNLDESVFRAVRIHGPTLSVANGYTLQQGYFHGSVRLNYDPNGQYQVLWGYENMNPLYLMITSDRGIYREPQVVTYSYLNILNGTGTGWLDNKPATGTILLDLELANQYALLPNTQYTMYVYGDFVDQARADAGMPNYAGFGLLAKYTFRTENTVS